MFTIPIRVAKWKSNVCCVSLGLHWSTVLAPRSRSSGHQVEEIMWVFVVFVMVRGQMVFFFSDWVDVRGRGGIF